MNYSKFLTNYVKNNSNFVVNSQSKKIYFKYINFTINLINFI